MQPPRNEILAKNGVVFQNDRLFHNAYQFQGPSFPGNWYALQSVYAPLRKCRDQLVSNIRKTLRDAFYEVKTSRIPKLPHVRDRARFTLRKLVPLPNTVTLDSNFVQNAHQF